LHQYAKRTKASEIAAKPWRKYFLVHEEVLHGAAAKSRNKGIGFKE
jgi:hypothetical protein